MVNEDHKHYTDWKESRLMAYINVLERLSGSDIKFKQRMSRKQSQPTLFSVNVGASRSTIDQLSDSLLSIDSTFAEEICAELAGDQNRVRQPNLAMTSEQYHIFDRASAAIVNAVPKDAKLITGQVKSHVIDQN